MRITEFPPSDPLRPFVRAIRVVETNDVSHSAPFPEPGLVLGIRFSGAAGLVDDGDSTVLPNASLTGVRTTVRRIHTSDHGGVVVAVFTPIGAAQFFDEPLHELFGEIVDLSNLSDGRRVAELQGRVTTAATNAQRVSLVDNYLRSRLRDRRPDPIVLGAIDALRRTRGTARIKPIAKQLAISQDALEKRFRRVVGASPKQLASILRFRHIVAAYEPGILLTTLAHEAGYFDQSHLIRDFRAVTGEAPQQFLRSAYG